MRLLSLLPIWAPVQSMAQLSERVHLLLRDVPTDAFELECLARLHGNEGRNVRAGSRVSQVFALCTQPNLLPTVVNTLDRNINDHTLLENSTAALPSACLPGCAFFVLEEMHRN